METRVRVFSRNGLALEEFDNVPVVRSWVLNGIGTAKFEIPKTDTKATETNLQFGNPILIEHDRAGAWGGVISSPRGWTASTIQVTAYDPGIYFKRRYTPLTPGPRGTPGDVVKDLISVINNAEDTLIREGDTIFLGGRAVTSRAINAMCWDALVGEAARSLGEWEFIPDTSTGILNFKMNWYQQAGQYRNEVALSEGHNIERSDGVTMIEEGEIVNSARGFIKGVSGGNIVAADAVEETSKNKFGLSQMIKSVGSTGDPQYVADGMVTNMAYPRRRWDIVALDVDNTFDQLRLGDTIQLMMPGYGFTNQAVGTSVRVRIIGREFDDSTGKMPLTVYEVF